jgi:putative spermidine/putrescine transport system ATP-binding protein
MKTEGARVAAVPGSRIELAGLEKTYPDSDEPAVKGIDYTIEPGEFVCFLGPSGSGKSTTLNLIAGLEAQTAGRVMFDGKDVSEVPTHKRNIGMVFQNYALFPHLSVGDNVAFPLRRRNIPRAEIKPRTLDALRLVGLAEYADRRPDALSGGQRQRVALARALVYEPSVLLMDEPLGALDKALRGQLQQEIRDLHDRLGMTVVFVTHDQEEALSLADRIAIFNEGQLHQSGTGAGLYARPKDLFVTQFLGEANIVPVSRNQPFFRDRLPGLLSAQDEAALNASEYLVLRPERLSVHRPSDPRFHEANRMFVAARMTRVMQLGGLTEIEVETEELGRLRVKSFSDEATGFSVGDQVMCSWEVDRLFFVSA